MVYHDHLSAMWEDEAVDYMRVIGLWDRLIKITGPNNVRVAKLYKDSIPGNSPENARGTDSHCFSDLMTTIYCNVALTSDYDDGNPAKFLLSTPKHCQRAIERAWSIIPESRIQQDLLDWPRINDKIIESQGTVVPGENLRGGRRVIKLDGTTPLKCKTTSRDRKDTLKATPIHGDSQAGLDFIIKFGQDAYDKLNKEVDEENDILQNLRDLSLDINDEYNDDDEDIDLLELGYIFSYFFIFFNYI